MAEPYTKMNADEDTPTKCRGARHHRAAMRRAANQRSNPSGSRLSIARAPASNNWVHIGWISVAGKARDMEDEVSLKLCLVKPQSGPPLHFAAVFDGHGGPHVAALCKKWMHVIMEEELRSLPATERIKVGGLIVAVKRSFERMDELALSSCACGYFGDLPCLCPKSEIKSEYVGSTAVVAVVGSERVLVANCGDSRAVISRGGVALPMSFDHKPDRPDELARITAAGGRVINMDTARVNGMLAMSRAIEITWR